jgi:hypothetical protein
MSFAVIIFHSHITGMSVTYPVNMVFVLFVIVGYNLSSKLHKVYSNRTCAQVTLISMQYHFISAVKLFSFLSVGYSTSALSQLMLAVKDFPVLVRVCYVTLPSFSFICIA